MRLSVVVVTFNSASTLSACLAAVMADLPPHVEVLVVDNASKDDSVHIARAEARAIVVARDTNIGFGGAVNAALHTVAGDYVLLLNPDAIVEPGALQGALIFMDRHPDVGIMGPRVILTDGRLDHAAKRSTKTPGSYFYKFTGLSALFPRSRRFGRYYLTYEDPDIVLDVGAVVGAFLMVRRETLEQIGPMDERFFMYCEDEDWCFQARSRGWRVVYNPEIVVRHRKGSSTTQARFGMAFHWHRSVFRFHRKNLAALYPAPVNILVYMGIWVGLLLKWISIAAVTAVRLPRRPAPAPVHAAPN